MEALPSLRMREQGVDLGWGAIAIGVVNSDLPLCQFGDWQTNIGSDSYAVLFTDHCFLFTDSNAALVTCFWSLVTRHS